MWDAAPSCSGATAPPPDDANAHKNRETAKRGATTEERHVECMHYRYRWQTRQTQKPPALRLALGLHCDSGYPNLPWLLTPVRNPRTRAEECYNKAHGRTLRIIEWTFGLRKARFRCLHLTGGSLFYSPKKVCQIIVACCMLHNLALRRQVPFLQEDGPDGGVVASVEPVDSEDEEAEEEDIDNRNSVILQYFQ
ncbi:hypothetical protein NDU88_005029 [Pleurodeles waltl]|uniref:DDE Tnp4 domain-containing protein n=1 Tax=Pleurodeles waltl TaxID=8319 RepID=A0AAV7UKX2_PLEWA|nr:hypothetical protein NDU88_005029 [Pleurodeles waltl]